MLARAALVGRVPADVASMIEARAAELDRVKYESDHRPTQQRLVDEMHTSITRGWGAAEDERYTARRNIWHYAFSDAIPKEPFLPLYMWAGYALPRASMIRHRNICALVAHRRLGRFVGGVPTDSGVGHALELEWPEWALRARASGVCQAPDRIRVHNKTIGIGAWGQLRN